MCDNSNNYFYIDSSESSEKIWTNTFRGNIVKSVYHPKTNQITQYSMPYNRINEYINYFNQEAKYKKNDINNIKNYKNEKNYKNNRKNEVNDFSCKIVNRNLELLNKFD